MSKNFEICERLITKTMQTGKGNIERKKYNVNKTKFFICQNILKMKPDRQIFQYTFSKRTIIFYGNTPLIHVQGHVWLDMTEP